MSKIAVIICTKDRPKDLTNLFQSIQRQSRKPDQIIVVDGSDNPIKHVIEAFPDLTVDYTTVRPPGLAKQRNVGIKMLKAEMDWVGMLDDDLVLEDECISNLYKFIDGHRDVKGIGLVINNQPTFRYNILRQIFLTDVEPGGIVTKSGMAAAIRPVATDLKVEWLYGGATFWNTSMFKEFSFDEWFSGVGYLEDVDFSYRVSRKYPLMLAASARCFHYHHPVRKERMFHLGAWHLVAWWYFASKHSFNKLLILWSMFFIFASNLGHGLLKPQSNRLRTALGNLRAFYVIFTGGVSNFKGFQK
jgi:GT2 family glycosyltransferase